MSIDGIGRPPGLPAAPASLDGPSGAEATESFHVDSTRRSTEAASSPLLSRLERGEIDVEHYLDARVEEAVAPLSNRLAPEALEFLRSSLRAELENDPVLVELVRRATASLPRAPER
jgi:hypothetical protein